MKIYFRFCALKTLLDPPRLKSHLPVQDSRAFLVYWSQRNFIHTVCVILSKPDSANSDEISTIAAFRLSQQCMKCLECKNKHLMSNIATALKVQSDIKSAWKKEITFKQTISLAKLLLTSLFGLKRSQLTSTSPSLCFPTLIL